MDNSATSYPKPSQVIRQVRRGLTHCFANPGRGTSRDSLRSSDLLYGARESLAELVGTVPENVIFTYNATYALNMALQGVIKKGMTVAYESFAHNSVLRPLYALEKKGVKTELLETDLLRDSVIISSFEKLVTSKKVDVLVVTHTSNVTGKRLPIKQLSKICRENGVLLIVDASQGIGSSPINMEKLGIDILASSGHKGLYGIMGTGFMAIRSGADFEITPQITGGSGIFSLRKEMPPDLPERLEAGTVGLPGIISMKAGAEYLMREGVDEIGWYEHVLRARLINGLGNIQGVRLYNADVNASSIVLFNLANTPSSVLADKLDREGVAVRAGYHCAPLVHSIIQNGNEAYDGAVRLSVGYFNTDSECDQVIKIINKLSKES